MRLLAIQELPQSKRVKLVFDDAEAKPPAWSM